MQKEKSCGAIVLRKENNEYKILLIQHNKGHWSFPKGHVEAGETEVMTALREIKEETGLDVTIDTGFRSVTTYFPKDGVIKDVIYFIAKAVSTNAVPQLEEVQRCEWLPVHEAKARITYENDKKIFDEALKFISQNDK